MPISENELKATLQQHFPAAQVHCIDLAGDDDHWEVTVVDAGFTDKSRIQQHRMVQQALAGYDIHALSIKTQTP